MTEPLYRLPNGNAITLEDVHRVYAWDTNITIKHTDDTTTISPSDDPPRDRDLLIEAVNVARARQAERDRPAPAFIVLTNRDTKERRIVNCGRIIEVFPCLPSAHVYYDDGSGSILVETVETFEQVAAMLGVKL